MELIQHSVLSEAALCPKCGQPLSPTATEGLCPPCVLRSVLDNQHSDPPTIIPPPLPELNQISTAVDAVPPPLPQPNRIGRYDLGDQIAQGGQGTIYRAHDIALNRTVALKMMRSGRWASDSDRTRFRTEAQAAAGLKHPNIVTIHEFGEHEGALFIAMDYVEGENFERVVERRLHDRRPIEPVEAAGLVKLLAEAIDYAHGQGVIHRDLKPSNVLSDEQGQPHITDFGLAKHLDHDPGLTLSGEVLGSPSFMAPEQTKGRHGQIKSFTDVYGLGGILYFLLTRRAPFEASTRDEVLHLVVHKEPVAPRHLNPSVPADLQTICLKCLDKDSRRRYQTAQELADDLGRFLRKEPIHARPAHLGIKLWRWRQRRPAVAALLGVLVVVSASAAFFFLAAIGGVVVSLQRAEQNAKEQKRLREIAEAALREYEGLNASYRACGIFRFQLPDGFQPILGDSHDMLKMALAEGGEVADIGKFEGATRDFVNRFQDASAQSFDHQSEVFRSSAGQSQTVDLAMFETPNHKHVIMFHSFGSTVASLDKLKAEMQARIDQQKRNLIADGETDSAIIDKRPALRVTMRAAGRSGVGRTFFLVIPEEPNMVHSFSVFNLSNAYDENSVEEFIQTMRIFPRRAR